MSNKKLNDKDAEFGEGDSIVKVKKTRPAPKKIVVDLEADGNVTTTEETLPRKKSGGIFSVFKKKEPLEEQFIEHFNPSVKTGLTHEQVKIRTEQMLYNDTTKKYSKSYSSIFLENIFTFFNLLCIVCAVALIFSQAPFTQLLFLVIFIFNLIIGIWQEIRAKKKIDKLSLLTSPTAKVIRNGEELEIPLTNIVLDDILLLSVGQQVPVDCLLKDGFVEVNESLLTGESVPIKKDKGDKILAGSFIASGSCRVIAYKVGKSTYLQSLSAKASKYKKPNSELLNSTRNIIRIVGILIPLICAGMAFVNWTSWQHAFDSGATKLSQLNYTIQYTASIAIGMIPSGMMLLTSLALAVGVIKLTKFNTLVQDLYSLEMLARVNVLCLDKTGTITDGQMKVQSCIPVNGIKESHINKVIASILGAMNDNNQTSIALYNHFGHNHTLKALKVLPFSSKRKLSAVSFVSNGTYSLGAPEFVLGHMTKEISEIVTENASKGLRVLVLAHSENQIGENDTLPNDMHAVAVITLMDNIREDAVTTIKWFKDNDVAIRIISGDNPITVSEVAKRVGVLNAEKFISLEGLNEKEVINVANQYTVFGRVTPEQKAILIKAIKREGNTVAMTGDGVNDILALKEADCAISVASGSEAARNVSNLVLMDNNFSSMPMVVNEGRRVINNIKQSASLYLMKTLFVTILALYCIIIQKSYPFTTGNMLLIEFGVIGAPSFFLSLQPNSDRVKGNFIGYVLSRSIPGGLILLYGVMCMNVATYFAPEIFEAYYTQMTVILFTTCGIVMLYRFCQPLNVQRTALFSIVILLAIVVIVIENQIGDKFSILFLKGQWQALSWSLVIFQLCVIQFAFPLSKWLIKLCEATGKAINKKRAERLAEAKHDVEDTALQIK